MSNFTKFLALVAFSLFTLIPAVSFAQTFPQRISVASDGTQGNDASDGESVTADGRYVTFESYASNLVPGDTNGQSDVFDLDTLNGSTTLISFALAGTQG